MLCELLQFLLYSTVRIGLYFIWKGSIEFFIPLGGNKTTVWEPCIICKKKIFVWSTPMRLWDVLAQDCLGNRQWSGVYLLYILYFSQGWAKTKNVWLSLNSTLQANLQEEEKIYFCIMYQFIQSSRWIPLGLNKYIYF